MGTLVMAVRSAGELPSRKMATRRFGCLTVRRFTSIMMQMILQFASWKTMVKTHAAIVLTILAFSASATAQTEVDTLIVGGHVFETSSKSFKETIAIAIKDGRLLSLDRPVSDFKAVKTIELTDEEYVLPGLIDCHAHYNVRLFKKRREEFAVMPVIYLANGITTTFSCGEFAPEEMLALRKRIESGEQIGPQLLNSGPYFGRARPGWRGKKPAEEIRDEVDFWSRQGVGGFKAKAIDPDSLKVLVEQAHQHGLTVTGHLDSGFRNSVNPRDAIELGIDRIEHFIGGDAMSDSKSAYAVLGNITRDMPEYEKAVQLFVDKNVVFDATLTAYGYPGLPKEEYDYWIDERKFFTPFVQEHVQNRKPKRPMQVFEDIYLAKQKTISAFHEAGGKLSMGTDHVSDGTYLPGFGAHRELDAFVRNGIPAVDALLIGTINGARALKIEKDYGSIENGKVADLFIVKGDPIKSIRNTRNVKTVIRAGKIYDAANLLESVRGKLGPADEDETQDW